MTNTVYVCPRCKYRSSENEIYDNNSFCGNCRYPYTGFEKEWTTAAEHGPVRQLVERTDQNRRDYERGEIDADAYDAEWQRIEAAADALDARRLWIVYVDEVYHQNQYTVRFDTEEAAQEFVDRDPEQRKIHEPFLLEALDHE